VGSACRPGDIVVAPEDIGLYAGGLTPCWPYVSHSAAPDHDARATEVRGFYGATPAERAAFLERVCAAHVVLPAPLPEGWLAPGTRFRPGPAEGESITSWSREGDTACTGLR
jgi:hypothetical protein